MTIVSHSIAGVVPEQTSWDQRWEGEDKGLICCWLRGIEKAKEEPLLQAAALRGEFPPLAWKGGSENAQNGKRLGSLYYLATWQGLCGRDLNIDTDKTVTLVCTRSKTQITFTGDVYALAGSAIESLSVKAEFDRLLSPHGIGSRLAQLKISKDHSPDFSATFVYPRFRQERILVEELCDKLINRITSFCMTREERRVAKAKDSVYEYETSATDALNSRARKLFIQSTKSSSRSGEGGELLLFVLAEEFLKAPLLVSKMRLKTNTQMPVHGSDGIHAGWDARNGALLLYIGESKLHATLGGAIRSAMQSVKDLAENASERYDHELNLAQSYSDLDGMPEEMKAQMLRFLDPWGTEESTNRIDRYAILIGFNEASYGQITKLPRAEVEATFAKLYTESVQQTLQYTKQQLQLANINLESVDVFFFAVPSVDEFRQTFLRKLNA